MPTVDAPGAVDSFRVTLSWPEAVTTLVFPSGISAEIAYNVEPVPIPYAAAGIAGLVGAQGRPVAVFDLPDLGDEPLPARAQILIVRQQTQAIALRTRGVPGFTTLTGRLEETVQIPLPSALHEGAGEPVAIAAEPFRGRTWDPFRWARARVGVFPASTNRSAPVQGNLR